MALDLGSLAPGLQQHEDGIWFAARRSPVSYPSQGNAGCLAVEDRSFWFRHRNRCLIDVVCRFAPQGAFLDIGGGNGYVARGLATAQIDCVVMEPGLDGARAAHARGIGQVICAALEETALPTGCIAAAGMFDVLEHIETPAASLQEVHRLLPPHGPLFLTVPAYPFLFSADDTAAGHFRRYTSAGLARVLQDAGFKVTFSTYLFAPLPPLIFLLRTVPSRMGLRQGVDPERETSEHVPHGVAARMMDALLAAEYRTIKRGGRLPFGASCLAVAIKE